MKITNLLISNATKYLFINRWKFMFLIPLFMFIDILSKMPYLGLLLTFENKIILFWILIVFVLRIGYRGTASLSLILLALSIFSSIRERTVFAEQIGIIITVMIFITFIQSHKKNNL